MREARLAARAGAGLGQQEVAEALGLSQASISDYERGRRRPNLATLLALARLLEVSADWLLTGESPPAASDWEAGGGHPTRGRGRDRIGDVLDGPVRQGVLDSSLADLLGLCKLTYLGEAGLVGHAPRQDHGAADAGAQTAAATIHGIPRAVRAAEDRLPYEVGPPLRPGLDLAISREMSAGAESVILYTGPACAGLSPGDLLLVGPEGEDGPAMYVVSLGTAGSGTAFFYAVAPADARPEAGSRRRAVLAILRRATLTQGGEEHARRRS